MATIFEEDKGRENKHLCQKTGAANFIEMLIGFLKALAASNNSVSLHSFYYLYELLADTYSGYFCFYWLGYQLGGD
jgi:hypothetical protein